MIYTEYIYLWSALNSDIIIPHSRIRDSLFMADSAVYEADSIHLITLQSRTQGLPSPPPNNNKHHIS